MLANPNENRHGSELGDDAESDDCRQRKVVEDADRRAAEEPENSIAGRIVGVT
jgi:hypothetical protein